MESSSAKKLIRNTFEHPLDKTRFADFTHNLLKSYEPKTFSYQGVQIQVAYQEFIQSYEHLGKYFESEGKEIDDSITQTIFEVHAAMKLGALEFMLEDPDAPECSSMRESSNNAPAFYVLVLFSEPPWHRCRFHSARPGELPFSHKTMIVYRHGTAVPVDGCLNSVHNTY